VERWIEKQGQRMREKKQAASEERERLKRRKI
jgi:hypothetical protein